MSIKVRCECGKMLSFKDECEGKRFRCPACSAPLTVRFESSGGDEFDIAPQKQSQHWSRHPAVMTGAFLVAIAGGALMAYPKRVAKPTMLPSLAPKDFARAKQANPAVEQESPPKPFVAPKIATKAAINSDLYPIPIPMMPVFARRWATLEINEIFEGDPKVASFSTENIEVERLPDDKRKMPWRWIASAITSATFKPTAKNPDPQPISLIVAIRFTLPPEGLPSGEISREITNPVSSEKLVKAFRLEWSDSFQARVRKGWLYSLQEMEAELRRRALEEPNRNDWLEDTREEVAKRFEITMDELKEIVEAK